MRIAITGVRDGLLELGLAILLCVLLVGSFSLAETNQINRLWVYSAWGSFMMVPVFLRAFRGNLKQPYMKPFFAGLAVVHGLIFIGLAKWGVPLEYWFPVFIAELSLGAWASYRFFGVIPSGDI